MSAKTDKLVEQLKAILGARIDTLDVALGEVTLTVSAANFIEVARSLRDDDALSFEFQGAGQKFWKVLAQPNFIFW
jgi:NADH-quinone oxidoreductase subunit C